MHRKVSRPLYKRQKITICGIEVSLRPSKLKSEKSKSKNWCLFKLMCLSTLYDKTFG